RLCHTHYPVCLYSLSTDSAHHHVLPSLPTRRSSDLGAFHERHDVAHAEDAVGHAFRMENLKGVHLLARRDEFERLVHHRTDGDGDRKSTRLNSSHVSISYAVFCLKKKK